MTGPAEERQLLLGGGGLFFGTIHGLEFGDILEVRDRLDRDSGGPVTVRALGADLLLLCLDFCRQRCPLNTDVEVPTRGS